MVQTQAITFERVRLHPAFRVLGAGDRRALARHLCKLPFTQRQDRFHRWASDDAIRAHCDGLDFGATDTGIAALSNEDAIIGTAIAYRLMRAENVEIAVTVDMAQVGRMPVIPAMLAHLANTLVADAAVFLLAPAEMELRSLLRGRGAVFDGDDGEARLPVGALRFSGSAGHGG